MAGRGQSVGAHAAVVFLLVGSLPEGRQPDDDVTRLDVGVVDDVFAFHAAGDCGVYNNRAHEVADVCCFPACGIDAHPEAAVFFEQLFRAVDDGGNDFAGNQFFVAPDGGGQEDVIHCPDA